MTHSRYEEVKHTAGGEYEITRDNNQPYISETTLRGGFFVFFSALVAVFYCMSKSMRMGRWSEGRQKFDKFWGSRMGVV